jgi:hypothetical protein
MMQAGARVLRGDMPSESEFVSLFERSTEIIRFVHTGPRRFEKLAGKEVVDGRRNFRGVSL